MPSIYCRDAVLHAWLTDPKLNSQIPTGRLASAKTICNVGAEGHILTITASHLITYILSHPFKFDLVDFMIQNDGEMAP